MEVILLESIRKLGIAGSKVKVKDGFGRNYLIPFNKAIRATKNNLAIFEEKKALIEIENAKSLLEAQEKAAKLDNLEISIVRQASNDGKLFGSVGSKDIVLAIQEKGYKDIERSNIILSKTIKTIDSHEVAISLHPQVNIVIKVNVIRSEDEKSDNK